MHVMAREYARVVGFALPRAREVPEPDETWSLDTRRRAVVGLFRSTLPYVAAALSGLYSPR